MKTAQIKSTKDYSLFAEDKFNRCVRHNKGLLDSMKQYGWLDAFPMLVVIRRGKMIVKDGQHRLEYAKRLGIAVKYVVVEEDGIEASKTSVGLPWSLKDYAASHAKRGNPDYARLLSFKDETGLSVGMCADLLSGKAGVATSAKAVKSGEFKITHESAARSVVSVINSAKQVVKWGSHQRFVAAIAQAVLHAGISVGTLCDKIRSHPGKLVLMPTTGDFVQMIEGIYNYRNQKPVAISHAVKTALTRKHHAKDTSAS